MINLTGRLVEVSEEGTYQGSPYASLKLRTATKRGDEIVKFKINLKEVNRDDVATLLDKNVSVTCDLERGVGDNASLRVVAVDKL